MPSGNRCGVPARSARIWDVYASDGTPLGNAARLDLSFMLLSDAETAGVHEALFRKGGAVLGYLDQGSWTGGSGPTLLVAGILDRAP
jgi:hypothetical protein